MRRQVLVSCTIITMVHNVLLFIINNMLVKSWTRAAPSKSAESSCCSTLRNLVRGLPTFLLSLNIAASDRTEGNETC